MASTVVPPGPGRFAHDINPLMNLFRGNQAFTALAAPATTVPPPANGNDAPLGADITAPAVAADPNKTMNYSDTTAVGLIDPELVLSDTPALQDEAEAVDDRLVPSETATDEAETGIPSTGPSQDTHPPRVATPQPPTTFVRALPLPPREVLPAQLVVLSRRLRYPAAQRLRFLQALSIYMHYQLGGDLNRAVQTYHGAVEAFRGDATLPRTLRTFSDNTPFAELQPFEARTIGGQRLEALALLRDGLWNMSNTGRYSDITDSVLLETLEHFRWVVEDAAAWIIRGGDLDQIVDRIADLRTPHPSQYQQDERWARFITMTSTNSHYSAQQFLAKRQYDYAAALNDWARLGHIPLLSAPPATTPRQKKVEEASGNQVLGLRIVVANHESEDGGRQQVAPLDGTTEGSEIVQRRRTTDEGDDIVERKEYYGDFLLPDEDVPSRMQDARPSYSRADQSGFLLDADFTPPILGYPDPTKFYIERIVKGKYAPLSHALKSTMDWNSVANITTLCKWRNEESAKITRVLKRPGAVAFIRAEIDFLYFEEARHFEHSFRRRMRRIARANPNMTLRETRLRTMAWFDEVPVLYKMTTGYQDKITRRFNKKFAGKTVVDGVTVSAEPRPERSHNSLNQQRHRSRMICRDFRVTFQPARGPRILPNGRTDDEDSDYKNHLKRPNPWVQPPADSDDTESEDESSGPRSTGDEGGDIGDDDSEDDDDDEEGDGAATLPGVSTRRVTRQSQGQINAASTSGQAAGQAIGSSAVTGQADDAFEDEETEEGLEEWDGDDEEDDADDDTE